ncbi:beta-galactosidase [Halobacillus salinarum]|uniref:Beta-galactosidase n=1 Tax=Halobacillus salinarum TaxID=2932257 RepID=A0ABY4EP90_9BACI|nr:beta-galactosidase [Halobacillus salinarum]UOQ45449.1 beta-galactosidase [Halobacillus salinarum]
MVKKLNEEKLTLGICYYPEHWPEDMWEDDYRRMKELGITYVRMGEFAWSIFEPEEGKFSFDLFDRAVAKAGEFGLKVIMGTPTATPPTWLTKKYPDSLNVTQDGIPYQHGARRHYNYNSENYRRLSSIIVKKMAEHYHDHPDVVGWQIDNELNCETDVFYSEADHDAFREWAKKKYHTLENLNAAWGAVFWNQTYTSWDQVYLTRKTVPNSPNPHHALDEKRFFSDSAISYAKLQADILREYAPKQWVTTNGMFGHLDNHKLTDDLLDFYAYDSYPNFGRIIEDHSVKPLRDRKWSWNLSVVRSISPNFAIFEQQSGPGGWVTRIEQPSPKPGQLRLWTYQSIAHGADMIMYFRWRTATKGTEIYWHGINDYHNQPNRRVKEVEAVSQELHKLGQIAGSSYQAEIAYVTNYDNEWDAEFDKWVGPYEAKSKDAWFKALQYNHVPVDAFHLNAETSLEDLKSYKVLVYPHAAIITKEQAELFNSYVKQGGKMIFGCRSGYKDETGQPYMKAFPGYLADLVGVNVEEFTREAPFEETPGVKFKNLQEVEANDFNEVLQLKEDVEVLGTFTNAHFEGKPALVKRNYGQGSSYYFGGVFNLDLASLLIDEFELNDYQDLFDLPEQVELSIRHKEGTDYVFLLNYSEVPQEVTFKKEFTDLITGRPVTNKHTLKPFDVIVLA